MKKLPLLLATLFLSGGVAHSAMRSMPGGSGGPTTNPVSAAQGGTGSSTTPSSGQVPVGNAGGTAYAPKTLSNDCTLASTGAITCLSTNGTLFGTMAVQAASAVAITGGTINGTTTGVTTPAAGKFTTLNATTSADLTNNQNATTVSSINNPNNGNLTIAEFKVANDGTTGDGVFAVTGVSYNGTDALAPDQLLIVSDSGLSGGTAITSAGGTTKFYVGGFAAGNLVETISSTSVTNRLALINTGITADTAHTDTAVCQDTTSHQFYSGTGTLGVCLGTSSARYKKAIVPLKDGLGQIAALKPVNFFYKKGHGDDGAREQYGFVAEDVVKVMPKLVGMDLNNKPNSVDLVGMVPVLVKAMQEMQVEIDALKTQNAALKSELELPPVIKGYGLDTTTTTPLRTW